MERAFHNRKIMTLVALLVLAACLWAAVTYLSPSSPVSAQEAGQEARQRQEALTDSLTEGKVFYITTSRHDAEALGIGMPEHTYPQDTTDETWMLVGEDGVLASAMTKVYNPNGGLIAISTSGGSATIYHDLIANEEMEFPDITGGDLAGSLGELWGFSRHLESGGYASSDTGILHGEDSTIYSRTTTRDVGGVDKMFRSEIEMVTDAPLLHRESLYAVSDGVETLLTRSDVTSYSVLPSGSYPAN